MYDNIKSLSENYVKKCTPNGWKPKESAFKGCDTGSTWDHGHDTFQGPFLWSREISKQGMSVVNAGNPWDWTPPIMWSTSMKIEWQIFTLSLKHWSNASVRPIDPVDIYAKCMTEGPKFSQYLKKWRDFVWRQNASVVGIEYQGEEEDFPDVLIHDIEDIFPPVLLYCWKLPDSEDYTYCLEESKEISKENQQLFKIKFKELLSVYGPKKIDQLTEIEWVNKMTTSKTFRKGKKMPVWKARALQNEDAFLCAEPENFKFYAMPVQKNSFETRSAVACEIETLNSIQYLDSLGKKVFEFFPQNWMAEKDFSSAFKKLNVHGGDFLLSDIKKAGLTFPHALFKLMYEILKEEYPGHRWDFLLGFSDAPLYWNNTKHSIKRGYNLGMANEYATAALITIFHLFKGDEDIIAGFFNDDQFIKINHDNAQIEFDRWNGMLESYSILPNYTKSYVAHGIQFCEYYKGFGRIATNKVSQYMGALLRVMHCYNIVNAKSQTNSLWTICMSEFPSKPILFNEVLLDLLKFWGTEFPKCFQEYYQSFRLGGWVTTYSDNLDCCLHELEDINGNTHKMALHILDLEPPRSTWRLTKTVNNLIKIVNNWTFWNNFKDIPKEWNPSSNMKKWKPSFKGSGHPATKKYWDELLYKRQNLPKHMPDTVSVVRHAIKGGGYSIPDFMIDETIGESGVLIKWPDERGNPLSLKTWYNSTKFLNSTIIPTGDWTHPGRNISIHSGILPVLENLWGRLQNYSNPPIIAYAEYYKRTHKYISRLTPRSKKSELDEKTLSLLNVIIPYNREGIELELPQASFIIAARLKISPKEAYDLFPDEQISSRRDMEMRGYTTDAPVIVNTGTFKTCEDIEMEDSQEILSNCEPTPESPLPEKDKSAY